MVPSMNQIDQYKKFLYDRLWKNFPETIQKLIYEHSMNVIPSTLSLK